MDYGGGAPSSGSFSQHHSSAQRHRKQQQQHHHSHQYQSTPSSQQQQHHHQGEIVRQTPPSAQHYRGSVASVSRQERFRRQQEQYFPGIGLDYVHDDHDAFIEDHHQLNTTTRTPSPLVLDPSQSPMPSSLSESKPGVVSRFVRGIGAGSRRDIPPHHQHPDPFSTSRSSSGYRHEISSSSHHHPSNPPPPPPPTAADFARRAPRAGFLEKLGTNIPTFKRRFFILQPTTQLYYFLSPNDAIPRGAIAIDDATAEIIDDELQQQDGRGGCRIRLQWPDGHRIVLEAKTKEIAQEWCDSLQQERLSYVKQELSDSQQQYAQAQYEIQELKQQLENYRFVEQDRDGALEDARRWKEQFEQLDEAMRLLANHVRKFPSTTTTSCNNNEKGEEEKDSSKEEGVREEKLSDEEPANDEKLDSSSGKKEILAEEASRDGSDSQANAKDEQQERRLASEKEEEEKKEEETANSEGEDQSTGNDNKNVNISRDISLLDDDAAAEVAAAKIFESKNIMEELDAPGQHFPSLVNACQQLRENLRLASEEASTAVEDTKVAQDLAQALQSRMTKAEKQLCQLWEENCSIRKTLKQKKREKRVLVREVKSLLEKQEEQHTAILAQQQQQQQQRTIKGKGKSSAANVEDDASTVLGSDEEKLINELEEHVVSSIRLHEEFLTATNGHAKNEKSQERIKPKLQIAPGVMEVKGALSSSSTAATTASTHSGFGNLSTRDQSNNGAADTTLIIHNSRRGASQSQGAPLASLFDSNSESDSEVEEAAEDKAGAAETNSLPFRPRIPKLSDQDMDARSISSVAASFGGDSQGGSVRSRNSTPLRPNPLLQLDQDNDEEQRRFDEEALEAHNFKPISLAQRGRATSRLVCPLADVVGTKVKSVTYSEKVTTLESQQEDLQIYHLTFYTRKIGLQFQKVPAPPVKSRGLLTDAMTADLAGAAKGGCKTATDLKTVAAMSTFAKPASKGKNDDDADSYLQVATPIDAVLVCGFEGFDDSGNNVRPKLGARLVAFDGVSVEIGRWTFDSIRKAIQARGRPLTLSFRNDFLTTEQRAIMTKAVGEMDQPKPQATPVPPYVHHQGGQTRPPSAVPSLQSAISHETEHFVNETTTTRTDNNTIVDISKREHQQHIDDVEDDLTVSTIGYYSDHHVYHHQPTASQPPHRQERRRFTASSAGSCSQGSFGGQTSSTIRPTRGNHNYRSFSEAGSSASALSSAVGPLLSNLMSGLSAEKKQANFTPDYLHRRQSVEDAPQHQDFTSNLL